MPWLLQWALIGLTFAWLVWLVWLVVDLISTLSAPKKPKFTPKLSYHIPMPPPRIPPAPPLPKSMSSACMNEEESPSLDQFFTDTLTLFRDEANVFIKLAKTEETKEIIKKVLESDKP